MDFDDDFWLQNQDDVFYQDLFYDDYQDDDDYVHQVPRSKFFPKKALHLYTEAERSVIEASCRKRGKESPWDYKARLEKMNLEGKETPSEYARRKLQEPINQERKNEAKEIPAPKKPSHKATLNLQQQRNMAGMSQKEAAGAVNIPVKLLQEWEKGKVKPSGPRFGKLKSMYKRKISQKSKK